MEQENQEQDSEMKQEFQSYRDEIKNKVRLRFVILHFFDIANAARGRFGYV